MDSTNERVAHAPPPTAKELRRRRNLALQLLRFLSINWTMWRLARKSH
ncbi:hypothetical protein ACNI3K_08100 [Demequina sp. SO4-13]